jgi:hypothetical protein
LGYDSSLTNIKIMGLYSQKPKTYTLTFGLVLYFDK